MTARIASVGALAALAMLACGARTTPGGSSGGDASVEDASADVGPRDGSVDAVPPDVAPGDLLLWLRADLGVEVSGDAVTAWRDQSGWANDATQGTAAFRPRRLTSNLPPVVDFDGIDDHLAVPAGFADFTGGFTCFVFARTRKTTPFHAARFIDFAPTFGSLTSSVLFVRFGAGDELFFQTYQTGTPGPYTDAPGAVIDGAWTVYSVVMQPGSPTKLVDATVFTNGVARASGQVHPPDVVNRASNLIARSNLGGIDTWLAAEVAELRIYRRALGAAERGTIESELHARWKR